MRASSRCVRALIAMGLLAGCGSGPVLIDARRDATAAPPDAARASDASALADAAARDAGAELDGGASSDGGPACEPPVLPTWEPVDTMGPEGEGVLACIARVGSLTDERVPADQSYDLTTFGGPGDEQPVACADAPDADGSWYYAANAQRFSCGQRVRLVDEARTRCVVVEVADVGPHACVEEAGREPIWDVSPLASQHLFDVESAGWSEHRAVRGAPVGGGTPLGPCDAQLASPADFSRGFIGGPCLTASDCSYTGATCRTEAEGWPGGHCSLDCETGCPDRVGPHAYTACAPLDDGSTACLARCDFTLFSTGCREGYRCERRAHPTGSGSDRWVCLPSC